MHQHRAARFSGTALKEKDHICSAGNAGAWHCCFSRGDTSFLSAFRVISEGIKTVEDRMNSEREVDPF